MERTSNDKEYRQLLQKLILQGMIKMLEENVEVKCLARDSQLIQDIIPEC